MSKPHGSSLPLAMRRKALALAGSCLCLAGLAACSGTLLPQPDALPARYTLDHIPVAVEKSAPALTGGTIALLVALPRAAPGYGSRAMVYQRRPQELEAFARHEWVDTPARMLAPMLVGALQHTAGFRVVLLAPSAAAAHWRLETELIRLHQDFNTRPSRVRLSLRAVLVDSATRQALAWQEFDASVAAKGDDPVAGAQAAQEVTRQVLTAVAVFCVEQARLSTPSRP